MSSSPESLTYICTERRSAVITYQDGDGDACGSLGDAEMRGSLCQVFTSSGQIHKIPYRCNRTPNGFELLRVQEAVTTAISTYRSCTCHMVHVLSLSKSRGVFGVRRARSWAGPHRTKRPLFGERRAYLTSTLEHEDL
jgi:hypothetical protein